MPERNDKILSSVALLMKAVTETGPTSSFSSTDLEPTSAPSKNSKQVDIIGARIAASAEVEAYSRSITDAINRRDFDGPILKTLAWPTFYASRLDIYAPTNTWDEHMETFKKMIAESPEYHMRIVELSVDMSPDLQSAEVYITCEISGRPVEVKRNSLGVLAWRKMPQGWRAISHVNMRSFIPS